MVHCRVRTYSMTRVSHGPLRLVLDRIAALLGEHGVGWDAVAELAE